MSTVVPLIPLPADVSGKATEDGSTIQARATLLEAQMEFLASGFSLALVM